MQRERIGYQFPLVEDWLKATKNESGWKENV